MGPQELQEKRDPPVCKAPLDSLGPRAPLVPKARMGDQGTLVREENWVFRAIQAHRDQLESWALRGKLGMLGLWATGAPQGPPDLQENMAFRALKAVRVSRETRDHRDHWGRKDQLDSGACLVPKELLETPDLLA